MNTKKRKSPSFSNTTFQNLQGISYVLFEVPTFWYLTTLCSNRSTLLALWQAFFSTPHVPYSSVVRHCHQWDASHRLKNTRLGDVRETVSKSVRNCINKDRSRTTSIVNLRSFCCQFRHCNSFYHSFLCWQAITLGLLGCHYVQVQGEESCHLLT
jgi:hypothetical protein